MPCVKARPFGASSEQRSGDAGGKTGRRRPRMSWVARGKREAQGSGWNDTETAKAGDKQPVVSTQPSFHRGAEANVGCFDSLSTIYG
eukprot:6177763-Pleurochrysis_carterae.AAC.1